MRSQPVTHLLTALFLVAGVFGLLSGAAHVAAGVVALGAAGLRISRPALAARTRGRVSAL